MLEQVSCCNVPMTVRALSAGSGQDTKFDAGGPATKVVGPRLKLPKSA